MIHELDEHRVRRATIGMRRGIATFGFPRAYLLKTAAVLAVLV